MNLKVRINNRTFDVMVGNTNVHPIIVEVDGDIFEVWADISNQVDPIQPQNRDDNVTPEIQKAQPKALDVHPQSLISGAPKTEERLSLRSGSIRAPIPGVITAVNVKVGAHISVGEELFKLEAMKMNNSIRSNRAGVVKTIPVTVGQIVKLNEELLAFSS